MVYVGHGEHLEARDLTSGAAAWQADLLPLGGPPVGRWDPIVWGDRVLIDVGRNATAAFSTGSGSVLWHIPVAGPRIVVDDALYVLSVTDWVLWRVIRDGSVERKVILTPPPSGKRQQRLPLVGTTLVVSTRYAIFGDVTGRVYAFDRETGSYVWSHRPDGTNGFVGTRLVVAGGRLDAPSVSVDEAGSSMLYCYGADV
jgi:outer membrane protein assembly factor BamB